MSLTSVRNDFDILCQKQHIFHALVLIKSLGTQVVIRLQQFRTQTTLFALLKMSFIICKTNVFSYGMLCCFVFSFPSAGVKKSLFPCQVVTCVQTTGTVSVRCTALFTLCAGSSAPAARQHLSPYQTSLIG